MRPLVAVNGLEDPSPIWIIKRLGKSEISRSSSAIRGLRSTRKVLSV